MLNEVQRQRVYDEFKAARERPNAEASGPPRYSTSDGANELMADFLAAAEDRAAKLRRDEEERKRPEQLRRERALAFSDAVGDLFEALEYDPVPEPEADAGASSPARPNVDRGTESEPLSGDAAEQAIDALIGEYNERKGMK